MVHIFYTVIIALSNGQPYHMYDHKVLSSGQLDHTKSHNPKMLSTCQPDHIYNSKVLFNGQPDYTNIPKSIIWSYALINQAYSVKSDLRAHLTDETLPACLHCVYPNFPTGSCAVCQKGYNTVYCWSSPVVSQVSGGRSTAQHNPEKYIIIISTILYKTCVCVFMRTCAGMHVTTWQVCLFYKTSILRTT